ncbi:MAG: FtsW/RodA/SpoVE family cell cycle protein [Clostridia bacterium]|nr:FtsW/RodA/SpoVE family cell cycle protein [Clostridia bacterium]
MSEYNRENRTGRTGGAPQRREGGRPVQGAPQKRYTPQSGAHAGRARQPVVKDGREIKREGPSRSNDPRRERARQGADSPRTGSPVERKRETALTPADEKSRGVLQKFRANLVTKREERDERWDNEKIERQRHGVDRPMLIIILILIALGTVMVFSASYPSALKEKNDSFYYISNQLLWVALGGGAMTLMTFVPYKLVKVFAPAAAVVSAVLLVMVLIIGTARGVAQRWLSLGFVSFQPSELAKAALILFLAYYIDKNHDEISKSLDKKKTFWKGVAIPGIIVGGFCGLVLLEKHLSGTIILGLIGFAIIFISGADIAKMLITYGVPCGAIGLIYLLTNEYALKRILTHNDENADVLAEAWQTTQGLYAIGSGGLFGMGLGKSNLKFNYVSEAHNDFIFTIWCEELGLVGAVLLIALYGFFVWRGITIAKKAPDIYSSLVAFGITFQVGIQAALNIMVVTDLIPNTGVSLPFFSYGGTSLIILMAEMGILLSISKHSYQKK